MKGCVQPARAAERYKRHLMCWLYMCVAFGGCVNFKDAGKDLIGGVTEGLKHNADTIGTKLGAGAMQGIRDTLTSAETQARFDTLIARLGKALVQQATASRDTLLGENTRSWIVQLKNELLGRRTKEQLADIRDELLGPRTSGFLNDSLRRTVANLRAELLGAATRSAIDSIVSSAIATLSSEYRERMQPLVREEGSFVKRNATELLWTAGGVIAAVLVVAGVMFIRRRRDREVLDLLTYQIHEISNQQAYDELVRRIQKKAQELGIEPRLQKVLQEHGIQGKESWSPPP